MDGPQLNGVFAAITDGAVAESPLWAESLAPEAERELVAVFSPLTDDRYAVGLETIYEGYLLHYGRARLFRPPDADTSLLLGDYLYAHGLVRIAALDDVDAISDLAELISLCAHLRADGGEGDGVAWAATGALLGRGGLAEARATFRATGDPEPLAALARAAAGEEAVDQALDTHLQRVR